MTTSELILSVGVVALVFLAIFHILYVVSLRNASAALGEFIKKTEESLAPALIELRGALQNVRKITDDVGAVTEDIRQIADTAAKLEKSVRTLYESYKEGLEAAVSANIYGLKAGIKTGVVTLVKHLEERKE